MRLFIERLPEDTKAGNYPHLLDNYFALQSDRRGEFTERFAPMGGGFFLQTSIVESEDVQIPQDRLKAVAIVKREERKWRYVFPIYVKGQVLWKCQQSAPNPFEEQHLRAKSMAGITCQCPDCLGEDIYTLRFEAERKPN